MPITLQIAKRIYAIPPIFSAEKRMPGRPFFELLLLLQYATWGNDPRLFHWAGVVLYAVTAWVLVLSTWRACREWDGAHS